MINKPPMINFPKMPEPYVPKYQFVSGKYNDIQTFLDTVNENENRLFSFGIDGDIYWAVVLV